jgi:hypothetical protein
MGFITVIKFFPQATKDFPFSGDSGYRCELKGRLNFRLSFNANTLSKDSNFKMTTERKGRFKQRSDRLTVSCIDNAVPYEEAVHIIVALINMNGFYGISYSVSSLNLAK